MIIDECWAGYPVRFAIRTTEHMQFVAYYNAERQMVVASRWCSADQWLKKTLPSTLGWDSHNGIAMVVDRDGHLHVAGNVHASPLTYFRTTRPWDVSSLERATMVGDREDQVTYPQVPGRTRRSTDLCLPRRPRWLW